MTDITGEVKNGRVVAIVSPAFTGSGGLRFRAHGRELAYVGKAPETFPATITIDQVEMIATAKLPGRVPGFAVLWIPDAS